MWLLFAFIGVPLIEIALFIQIGGVLGLWPTLAIVVLTAIAGTAMVRGQGMTVLRDLQHVLERGGDPARPLAHGAMILFSGALLLTPGFFTDAVGFALLVPQVRLWLFSRLRDRVAAHVVTRGGPAASRPRGDDIIEGEGHEVDPDSFPPRPGAEPSGWTRR